VITLKSIAKKLESIANLNGREVLIESELPNLRGDFFVAINDAGVLGAFGNAIDKNNQERVMYFILDNSKVRYCLTEGWELDDIYKVVGDKLFDEVTEENFFEIMAEKKTLDL